MLAYRNVGSVKLRCHSNTYSMITGARVGVSVGDKVGLKMKKSVMLESV